MGLILGRILLVGIACVVAGSVSAADLKRSGARAAQPGTQVIAESPSGAEVVSKLLSEQTQASDPDVPLPQPNLSAHPSGEPAAPLSGPQLFGRQEDRGAVVGLKFPIPAVRSSY